MLKTLVSSTLFVVGSSALVLVASCGPTETTCDDGIGCTSPDASTGGASGDSGLGGNGGTGGSGGDGGTCDTTKSPSEESCLVADDYAIFVSPSGSDTADGTKSAPVQSWEKALSLGKAAGKVVIACNDDFTSPVSLTSAHSGTKLYGGFKCSDWSYDSAKKTKLAPALEGIALSLDGVVGFHIEDVIIEAKDATTPGASSIAMFGSGSSGVTLKRVDLKAGKGADGAKGVVVPISYPSQAELDGNKATGGSGGAAKPNKICPTSIGGPGGSAPSQAGGKGAPDHGGGQGGTVTSPVNCAVSVGKNGATPPPTPAASGATTLGTLSSTGWTPASGTDGKVGSPGQGGGGGASTGTAGGGGGGAGGCGGAGGPGGKGGGASIALLLLDTPITLDATVTLTTGAAGKGGNGVAGQTGQKEFGFAGDSTAPACDGGNGAPGADGGAGGGAAGGVSAAVLWKGATAPVVDTGTNVKLGTQGAKGIGGKPGSNDGIDGLAQDVVEVK